MSHSDPAKRAAYLKAYRARAAFKAERKASDKKYRDAHKPEQAAIHAAWRADDDNWQRNAEYKADWYRDRVEAKKAAKGFSLVDICIAMAVAAILALCAMPSFVLMAEQRQARAALGSLDAIRSDLTGYLIACDGNPNLLTGLGSLSHYTDRTNCNSAGPPQNVQGGPVGGLLSNVSLNGLSLTATVGGGLPALTGQQFHLSGVVIGSSISWTCTFSLPGIVLATHC